METSSWHSYPSIYALGHKALTGLLDDPVIIEEKVDGSQFSFGVFDGELKCRSKGATLNIIAPEGMFVRAVEVVRELQPKLRDGWTYRGEYLQKPKHNALAYDRTPHQNIIIFDINPAHEEYLPYHAKAETASELGLETVPLIFDGVVEDVTAFRAMLDRPSVLGGPKIEGVVVKNYARFGPDKKALMGKFVSEAFKEVPSREWKAANPTRGDIVQVLIARFTTPARWNKAIQHLSEAGRLEQSPRDIGPLMAEIQADVERECKDEIAEALYRWAWPQIKRAVSSGFPEFYKERLLEAQFS